MPHTYSVQGILQPWLARHFSSGFTYLRAYQAVCGIYSSIVNIYNLAEFLKEGIVL